MSEIIIPVSYDKQETISKADIQNDLTATTSGKVLDATQGKILNDNKLNKNFDFTAATLPYSNNEKIALQGTDGNNYYTTIGELASQITDPIIISPFTAFSIPASGSSVSYNLTGLTSNHELVRWNFSSSKENAPPVNLTWWTFNGYFTIRNDGGTTSESIKPVFALPNAIVTTNH